MWDFKFDAPRRYNFFRPEKVNQSIEINPDDPNDLWFLFEHEELTPIKEAIKQQSHVKARVEENGVKVQRGDQRIEVAKKAKPVSKVIESHAFQKPMPKPKIEKLKRAHINEKYNRQTSNSDLHPPQNTALHLSMKGKPLYQASRQNSQSSNISKAKSECLMSAHEKDKQKHKIRIPCPYSRKIQKDWESKSNKCWYSLSEKSAKKAMESMKKIQNKKKSPSKERGRFKF